MAAVMHAPVPASWQQNAQLFQKQAFTVEPSAFTNPQSRASLEPTSTSSAFTNYKPATSTRRRRTCGHCFSCAQTSR